MVKNLFKETGKVIWNNWNSGTRILELSDKLKPKSKRDAYEIQKNIIVESASPQVGWKIAATSNAGQTHIGVSQPLAGSLLEKNVRASGSSINLKNNLMRVAEVEFAFQMARDLPPRKNKYNREEVISAIDYLIPAIEIPDSRYHDFIKAGELQLIADNACAGFLVLGKPIKKQWGQVDLMKHTVFTYLNNEEKPIKGFGSNVLEDPFLALTWIANELIQYDRQLLKKDIVTTGTCVNPIPITDNHKIFADFGELGQVTTKFINS